MKNIILLMSLCLGIESNACISFPKKISLSDSSFASETFELPLTSKGVAFAHNKSAFFFNQSRQQWCIVEDRDKIDSVQPTCLNDGDKLYLTDDREGPNKNKELGLVQVSGKTVFLFSSKGKEKDTTKPYLKIQDASTVEDRADYGGNGKTEKTYLSKLNIEAVSFQKGQIGGYEISAPFDGPLIGDGTIKVPRTRSPIIAAEEPLNDITGMLAKTKAGCGSKIEREQLLKGIVPSKGATSGGAVN
jgi:hypothetical protein